MLGSVLKRQRGAAAIEFAIVFVAFLALVYAIVAYGMVFMLTQSFTYAAEDGLRAAIAVDCTGLTVAECTDDRITPAIRAQAVTSLSWLPTAVRDEVLGTGGSNVVVNCVDDTCTAEVRYNNYRTNPVIPALVLPLIGEVPRIPDDLVGRASLRV